jgi:perosamine synthetase
LEEFERKWAAYCGVKYGIAVSSGTAALQVAVRVLDLKPNDEIIMPTFTIISCALAVIYNQAKPVLVDCDSETWTINVDEIEEKINERTKAIMIVHIYGHPCNMDKIWKLAKKYELKIIEDAAEAHGAEYKNKRCGGLGDISCFSFYANKIITTGEGGMILTNNKKYAEEAKSLRNLCFRKDRRFYHIKLGYNFRFTNIQAAIGVAQIEKIEEFIKKKRWIAQYYTERLKDIPELILPTEKPWAKNVYWMYGIVLDQHFDATARELADYLYKCDIETRPFFLGIHEQQVFRKMGLFENEYYPVSEWIARKGLYLPSGLTLTEKKIEAIVEAIKKFIKNKKEKNKVFGFSFGIKT